MTTTLKYTGSRLKSFTVKCPSGNHYPVTPETSGFVNMDNDDAAWVLEQQAMEVKLIGGPVIWETVEKEFTPPSSPSTLKTPRPKAKE